jgi:hypothetical protein
MKWKIPETISVKLCTILSSVMESVTILPFVMWDMKHSSVQCIHTVYITHPLVTISVIVSPIVIAKCLCSSDP